MARSPSTTVKVNSKWPFGSTPGGSPSSSKPKWRWPAGAPCAGCRDGQGPFRRRAFDEQCRPACRRRLRSTAISGFGRIVHAPHAEAGGGGGDRLRHARLGRGQRGVLAAGAGAERQFGAAFRRDAQLLAHGVVELEAKRDRLARLLRRDQHRKDHARPCSRANCRPRRRTDAAPGRAPWRFSHCPSRKNRSAAARRNRPDSANRSSNPVAA